MYCCPVPLDAQFFEVADSLRVQSMGTEAVAPLLYSLVLMRRPRSVLEIGGGYSTLFLARALADARRAAEIDRECWLASTDDDPRRRILGEEAASPYLPRLHVIDDLSYAQTSAHRITAALDQLHLSDGVTLINADFRGASSRLPADALPLDFVWFDCRAAGDGGVPFLNEYWPLVRKDGGVVVLHSLQMPLRAVGQPRSRYRVPSPLLNELRKRQAEAGPNRTFELVSVIEPHKIDQGDVTILTRLGGLSHIRESGFENDAVRFGARIPGRLDPM